MHQNPVTTGGAENARDLGDAAGYGPLSLQQITQRVRRGFGARVELEPHRVVGRDVGALLNIRKCGAQTAELIHQTVLFGGGAGPDAAAGELLERLLFGAAPLGRFIRPFRP